MSRARPAWLPSVVAGLILLQAPQPAHASDAASRALAIQLFDEGDELMQQGKYAAACAKLSESNRLDPQLGALLYLAECYEKNGQLASAWGSYRQAEEIALKRGDERSGQAGDRARALEPRLSRIVLELPAGPRPPGYRVERDGSQIASALWDTAIPIDGGTYQMRVSAPGYQPWTDRVEVGPERDRVTVKVAVLAPEVPERRASADLAGVGLDAHDDGGDGGSGQRIAAIAVGGLGLAGLGVGGFFALSARSSFSDSEPLCSAQGYCPERGVELRDDADRDALVATIASSVGLLGVAAAAVLWFTAADDEDVGRGARPASDLAVGLAPGEVRMSYRAGF